MLLEDEEDEIRYTPPLIVRLATSSENLRESFIPCELTGDMERYVRIDLINSPLSSLTHLP